MAAVEIKIGLSDNAREVAIHVDATQSEIINAIREAAENKERFLELADEKGEIVLVDATRIAWVRVGRPNPRRVGFNVTD